MAFRVLVIGGTGQVGAAVVRALLAEPTCAEVVQINRRDVGPSTTPRLRHVTLDTSAPSFEAAATSLAQEMVVQGSPVYGASCVGVGAGSMRWSEQALMALEVGVVGAFARGCRAGGVERFALLSAVGSTSKSRFRYVRVMGLKEEAVEAAGFPRLAIFRPGIIAGNAHTPGYVAWLGHLIPGKFGVVEQDDIARAFVEEFVRGARGRPRVIYENREMKRLAVGAGVSLEATDVCLVLTEAGVQEAIAHVRDRGGAIWLNDGLMDRASVDALWAEGLDVTLLTRWIDPTDDDAIDDVLATMVEHHPDQRVSAQRVERS